MRGLFANFGSICQARSERLFSQHYDAREEVQENRNGARLTFLKK
jgi:hypothetical protein